MDFRESISSKGCYGLLEKLVFIFGFPLSTIVGCVATYVGLLVRGGPWTRGALLGYSAWALVDGSPDRGGFIWAWKFGVTRYLRGSMLWRFSARGRGNIKFQRTVILPPDEGPYIFANHPHGIIGVAPMTNFGTSVSGYEDLFPNIRVHLLGATSMFRIPFFREFCLLHGHGSVERSCCVRLLEKGHSIALAPGGARESLESIPGTMRLILKRRKGFCKLALQTDAALVPVLTFGENELYNTVQFQRGSWGRWCQRLFQSVVGFVIPLFVGRSWLLPLLPKRGQLFTVTGAPIRAEAKVRGRDDQISSETVDALHAKYCQGLRDLFDAHKAEFGMANTELDLV